MRGRTNDLKRHFMIHYIKKRCSIIIWEIKIEPIMNASRTAKIK
jgi:hypothetical protein